jgi:ferredoxin
MAERVVLDRDALDGLIEALRGRGYSVVGPTVRDGAIVYGEISSTADLPGGWTDEQEAGTYRLRRRDDDALFGYAVGPHSWKGYLFPPRTVLWRWEAGAGADAPESAEPQRYAFIGVRGCELRAMEIQDRVFLRAAVPEGDYAARREAAFVVAVNCGAPAATCFCTSMGTGPDVRSGYDVALTEVIDGSGHYFVAESGSGRGAEVLAEIPNRAALAVEEDAATNVIERTAERIGRRLDAASAPGVLARAPEAARWDAVAQRCLACGNCTMVCPTCFCSTVEDETDLTGARAERARRWDSCFTPEFSILGGASVRSSTRARYRQWLTHKFSTWVDQFGTSGCVGCGRCITWCPVGIDVTEEIAAIAGEATT